MVKFKEVKAKTVLNKYKYRDNWFWCRYSINPYRGCQFACNYRDAITKKNLVHENAKDFSRSVHMKTNAQELPVLTAKFLKESLYETISSLRWPCLCEKAWWSVQ